MCDLSSCCCVYFFFFFKQKTAYEMRISDWSSDVCSSDLALPRTTQRIVKATFPPADSRSIHARRRWLTAKLYGSAARIAACGPGSGAGGFLARRAARAALDLAARSGRKPICSPGRSEEQTYELQSLMLSAYAVLRL